MKRVLRAARRMVFTAMAAAIVMPAAVFASTADHGKFEALNKDFASGPEVTKACLDCHTEAGSQVMHSIHWKWEGINPRTGKAVGKKMTMNSFCGSPQSNEPRCTSCHVGYGWTDKGFDFSKQEQVDCLVCHESTGAYAKLPAGAGHPRYTPITKPDGTVAPPPSLKKIAQSVGPSRRENCGACHFHGGGGDGVKHGDLDSSLLRASKQLDVHMSKDGADMSCATCHTFNDHIQSGSRYATLAKDEHGLDLPRDDKNRASCESCHSGTPHQEAKLNDHTDRVACQTCHIPEFARGGVATKMLWDWSTAGKRDEKGEPLEIEDEHGHIVYTAIKGDFVYGENVRPTYKWFNGAIDQVNAGDPIDDSGLLYLNPVRGSADDPQARIWPFKEMKGKQPYDPVNKILAVNHVFGNDDTAFWTHLDYAKAIKAGMDYAGLPYSGKFDFIETRMYWPITHMVAPKEDAVRCGECHTRGQHGRLAGLPGFYMPGRDFSALLDMAGFTMLGLAAAGVGGHGMIRVVLWMRRRK